MSYFASHSSILIIARVKFDLISLNLGFANLKPLKVSILNVVAELMGLQNFSLETIRFIVSVVATCYIAPCWPFQIMQVLH